VAGGLLSGAVVDPRIYRTGLIAVLLAVIVVAFSLGDQPGALPSNLSPQAFAGQSSRSGLVMLESLAGKYRLRPPGSQNDSDLADYIAGSLGQDGFTVSKRTFATGARRPETVIGVLPGRSTGSVVVVSHRDAATSPGIGDLSGTVAMLTLAQALKNETQQRSIVLVSTSGTAGARGTGELAENLPGPVDAVITLGDLTSTVVRSPVIVPWSNAQGVASPVLRNTLAAALGAQAQLAPGSSSFASEYLHVALPMAATDQADRPESRRLCSRWPASGGQRPGSRSAARGWRRCPKSSSRRSTRSATDRRYRPRPLTSCSTGRWFRGGRCRCWCWP
jgi:hypothetical protein